jgi:hypothetical protein
MNVAMEQTEEYQDGQLKAKYGDAFLRGNNGAHLRDYFCSNCSRSAMWRIAVSFQSNVIKLLPLTLVCPTVMYISTQKRRIATGAK